MDIYMGDISMQLGGRKGEELRRENWWVLEYVFDTEVYFEKYWEYSRQDVEKVGLDTDTNLR